MRLAVRVLAAIAILAFAAGSAGAQVTDPGGSTRSSLTTMVSSGVDATSIAALSSPTTFTYGSLGWDLFLNSHANRLILAMSRWQAPHDRATVPVRVRMPIPGNRVTH